MNSAAVTWGSSCKSFALSTANAAATLANNVACNAGQGVEDGISQATHHENQVVYSLFPSCELRRVVGVEHLTRLVHEGRGILSNWDVLIRLSRFPFICCEALGKSEDEEISYCVLEAWWKESATP